MTPLSRALWFIASVGYCAITHAANAENSELARLLQQVEGSIDQNRQHDQKRFSQFTHYKNRQAELLREVELRLKSAEQEQQRLKQAFDENEAHLLTATELLQSRSGQLGEVFGVVKQQAQDLSGLLQDSMISAEYPERLGRIGFANEKRIPTLAELQQLWFLLLQEMTATAEVSQFEVPVVQQDGSYKTLPVTRIGPFVAVDRDGHYLEYHADTQQFQLFARQPDRSTQAQAAAFVAGTDKRLMIDPSRGNLLALLGRTPSVSERIEQAGIIGYLILVLGVVGLLLATSRILILMTVQIKIRRQLTNIQQCQQNNPLGRVLCAIQRTSEFAPNATSAIEHRLDETLLKEVSALEWGMSFLKLLAAVAPLLGLLGTVTGMIGTFQSITVFGTSDPKLMAGGISTALMTTVLGLCVAIPLLFLHSLIAARVRRLVQLLQQMAFAAVAERAETVIDLAPASYAVASPKRRTVADAEQGLALDVV